MQGKKQSSNSKYSRCSNWLQKIDLTHFQNLPPTLKPDPKECILASKFLGLEHEIGEVYEYATFISVERHNIQEFELNMAVLKSYYDDFR